MLTEKGYTSLLFPIQHLWSINQDVHFYTFYAQLVGSPQHTTEYIDFIAAVQLTETKLYFFSLHVGKKKSLLRFRCVLNQEHSHLTFSFNLTLDSTAQVYYTVLFEI